MSNEFIDGQAKAIIDAINGETVDKRYLSPSTNAVIDAIEHSGSDDAVKYTEQDLTEAQKAQARENIGAGTNKVIGVYENENIILHC